MRQGRSGLTPRGRHWLALVQEWERSGLTMREFCVQRGVKQTTFTWWRQQLTARRHEGQDDGRVELVEITGAGTPAAPGFEVALANGLRVRVPMRFEAAALQALLAVLGAC